MRKVEVEFRLVVHSASSAFVLEAWGGFLAAATASRRTLCQARRGGAYGECSMVDNSNM